MSRHQVSPFPLPGMITWLLAAAPALAALSCGDEECGAGQEVVAGECQTLADPDLKSADSGVKPEDDEEDVDPAFGQSCTSDDDCGDVANYCNDPTGAGKYCTRKLPSCDDVEELCPQFWSCVDLSGFNRYLKPVCTRPN